MKPRNQLMIAGSVILLSTVGGLKSLQLSGAAAEGDAAKASADDTAAIKEASQAFLKAYLSGDAKAMAARWTENGEYFSDDGTTFRGRSEIEKAYADLFKRKKTHSKAELEVTSIRFPSKDTAIEEGCFKARDGKDGPTSSKYSILHVREEGKWLMAVVREWPAEGNSLRDLEWLLGTWEAKHDDTEVRTTYAWWGDNNFIRVGITLKQNGRTREGFQMICKDRSTGQIRSWTFDPDGAFAEATWSRDGNKWIQDSAGVSEDGRVLAATNLLVRIDDNSFTFQSVERSAGGEEMADIPAVRVTRVKSK
jgi:uncharacterized protein (TIGR02246 family)